MIQKKLSVNLAVLFDKPTGIGVYLRNLLDHLKILNPTLLTNKLNPEFDCYLIPPGLTPNEGTKGHFRRLIWTQFQLPKIQKKLHSQLLFTPIPEAPLYQKQSFVTTVHDFIPLRFPRRFSPLSIYYRYYVPQVCRQAKHILTVSESTLCQNQPQMI